MAAAAGGACAQTWPAKPIRLIVPFPPGGGNDILARTVGRKLTEAVAQQVVIDNRGGAGGNIGAETAAHAVADGYTLFLGGIGSHGTNPGLQAKLPYDPVRDFAPITLIASAPLIVVVHPSLPVKSIAELVQYAKARPGQLNFASSGGGSIAHLAPEMLNAMAHVKLTHVPYKGTAPALVDLLSGQVQLMMNSAVSMLSQLRGGKLRAIAATGARRLAALPELPTVAESGVPGYEVASWYGLLAPAQTPRAIVDRLNRDLARYEEIVELASLTGEADYVMKLRCRDMKHLSEFLNEQLMAHPEVATVKTSVVLQPLKETTAISLAYAQNMRSQGS